MCRYDNCGGNASKINLQHRRIPIYARDGVLRQRVVDGERAAERVQRPAAAPEDGVADRQRPARPGIFSLGFSTPMWYTFT